ncbi:MAG: DUF4331 domain-containing protein [Myxococcota bacterium]
MTTIVAALAVSAFASSHREAPAISLDPSADITDFYAFVSPEDPSKVVFIMNVVPLELPGGGPNFYRFDDAVDYNIQCDNEGDGIVDKAFTFKFETAFTYPDEFLYNLGDIANPANVNIQQSYTVTETSDKVPTQIITGGAVAPANVGVLSDPTGGYNPDGTTPGSITASFVKTTGDIRTFAGPRQEGFFVDLERTFDLLNLNNLDNANTLLGYNVHSIAIEVPAAELTRDGQAPSVANQNEVIACWSTTSRPRVRIHEKGGGTTDSGQRTQVSRLGMPLVNEVVIPVSMKDVFNGAQPRDDAQFLTYVTDPILPIYMEAILGIADPISYDAGLGIGGREDLVLAFLTGHPALGTQASGFALGGPIPNEPNKFFAAFEALRINLTTTSGFPNGRLVTDDVTDVALSAMAGLLIDGTFVSDGVSSAGLSFLSTFPFLGDPWSGDDHPNATHDL